MRVIDAIRNSTAEGYFAYAAAMSILIAALLTQISALRFGSFWMMAGVLIGADLVAYVLMKLGVFKTPKDRPRPE
jgi:hypothetical protein